MPSFIDSFLKSPVVHQQLARAMKASGTEQTVAKQLLALQQKTTPVAATQTFARNTAAPPPAPPRPAARRPVDPTQVARGPEIVRGILFVASILVGFISLV